MALVACGGGQKSEPAASADPAEAAAGGEVATTSAESSEGTGGDGSGVAPVTDVDPSKPMEFQVAKTDPKNKPQEHPESQIKATRTEAALKFTVVDKEKGPIRGIVISLTSPDGIKYYTQETNAEGYAEVLVPVGKKYDLVYLALGRKDIAATVPVSEEPNQNVRLTLRYKRWEPPPRPAAAAALPEPAGFVLNGVTFDSGKASIRPESFAQLDTVVEYMAHKLSAKIEIAGHTDNVGNPKTNKQLSEKRAQACRDYLVSKGIDGARVTAVGYGDERPIAPNDTDAGRQENRRIEAVEL
ncbi:MAG: OmpA family protein [Myxococcales bacterium]